MIDTIPSKNQYVGYEYHEVVVSQQMETLYADSYANFGWELDKAATPFAGLGQVAMKFRRDRQIRNKTELTRLQRQFDGCINKIMELDRSKKTTASTVAYIVGILGCAFMAGAVFSYLVAMIPLCIILAIPGFIGWGITYFVFQSLYKKRSERVAPLIDQLYEQIDAVCEKAHSLLG